ncbi:MAG: type II toxin-antitoxin system Phd/YefM family antitoxin [Novosphingobium sp.]
MNGFSHETSMRLSTRVKPISWFKANAAEALADLAERREPMAITQNGEVKAIVQDIVSYEETQEIMALLALLAMGMEDVRAGRTELADDVFARLESKYG